LIDQLTTVVRTRLLDPLEILFGDDEALAYLHRRSETEAKNWAAKLLGEDDRAVFGTVMRLIAALYPGDTAFDPPIDWWRTPLGQVVIRRVGHPAAESVSLSVAGAMLGMTKQGVHDLVRRGKLTRHEDGGVTTESVRTRLIGADT
jgi:hypothetical protein